MLKDTTDLMHPNENDLTPAYIHYARFDIFMVSLYCNSQIDAFLNTKARVICLDATGNIVSNQNGKRTFYYSAVFKSELTNNIIPVFQFFSQRHDIPALSGIISEFDRDMKLASNSSKACISVVIVDFSFALMNAVSIGINKCSLFLYIELTHRIFVKQELMPLEITIIASCSVHVIKFFSNKLKEKTKHNKFSF